MMKRIMILVVFALLIISGCTIYEANSEAFILDNVKVYHDGNAHPDVLSNVTEISWSLEYITIDARGNVEHDYYKNNCDSVVWDDKILWKADQ